MKRSIADTVYPIVVALFVFVLIIAINLIAWEATQ